MKRAYILCLAIIVAGSCHLTNAQNVKRLSEVGSTIGIGGNPGGLGGMILAAYYTGGVSVGDYFSAGVSAGYMSLLFSNGITAELMVRGSVPFGHNARVGAWIAANGGYDFAIGRSRIMPVPLLSGSGGLFFRFKNGQRLFVGPSYICAYQLADSTDPKEKGWGDYLALKVSYSF